MDSKASFENSEFEPLNCVCKLCISSESDGEVEKMSRMSVARVQRGARLTVKNCRLYNSHYGFVVEYPGSKLKVLDSTFIHVGKML